MNDCDMCGGTGNTYTREGKGMCLLCEVVLLEAEVARLKAELAAAREALEKLSKWCTPAVLREGDYDRGMLCGVEDRDLRGDGYAAMRYGWDAAIERVAAEIDETILAALKEATP